MKTKTIKLYEVSDLEKMPDLKAKAIENLWDINVDYNWWELTCEDAENAGIKITEFDIYKCTIDGELLWNAQDVAKAVLKEHGKTCDTYKIAASYLEERQQIENEAEKDEDGKYIDEYEIEGKLSDLAAEFRGNLLEEYLEILRKEYEYLTSEAAIWETIVSNDYTFNDAGKIER